MENAAKPYDLVIVWRVTDFCNLNCIFCAHARTLTRPRTKVASSDVLAFGAVLGAYRQNTQKSVLMNWLGGEPLLWKPVLPLSRAYRALGIEISATTNGVPLTSPKVRREVVQNFSQLTISVDGFSTFHDAARGKVGLFDAVSKNVIALANERTRADSKLHLRMNVVLMKDNFDDFPKLCTAFAAWGVDEITYNQLGGRDRPENFNALRMRADQVERLEKLLPELKTEMAAKGVHINTNPDYLARFKAYARGDAMYVRDCAPGTNFLFIDEHARVAPCNFTIDDYCVPMQELSSLSAFKALPERFSAMQRSSHHTACTDCMSTRVSGKFIAKL